MQYPYLLVFFVFPFFVSAQHTSITNKDFNQDSIPDILKCSYEIGSNFGGTDCTLIDGKTQAKFNLTNYGCYCNIKQLVVISPELKKQENIGFLYALSEEVLPQRSVTPDQSLMWIIRSANSLQKNLDDAYFEFVFNPKNEWRYGTIKLPHTYFIEMGTVSLAKIFPDQTEKIQKLGKNDKVYLVYYGDTHFENLGTESPRLEAVAENSNYQIFKSKHGVLAKKGTTHKWLFVTDKALNDSPEKLRWKSIADVQLIQNYVLVQQTIAPDTKYHLYLIDIETGLGGQLKIDFDQFDDGDLPDLTAKGQFLIKDDLIYIGPKDNRLKFSLPELKQHLHALGK